MPPEIPSIANEAATIEAELAGAVGGSIPAKSVLSVLAASVAGSIISIYRYAGRRYLDMFSRHASTSETTIHGRTFIPLVELGNMLGVGDPLPAVRAQLQLFVHVTDTSGTLPAGTLLVGATNGVSYITKSALDLGVHETVTVIATEDPSGGRGYGSVGNLPYGSTLTFSSPMAGVSRDAMISGTLVSGSNGETWDAYRKRVHEARRVPPQGGSYADYRRWAKTVNGIEEAFPYTGAPGCVNVYIRATPESYGNADGIPTVGQIAAVLSYLNGTVDGLATRRPINDGVSVLPITRRAFDIEVHGLAVTNREAAEAAIFAACDEHLRTREPFIVGLSALPRIDRVTNAELSGVVSQVVASLGGTITSVVLLADSEDVLARTLELGDHAKLGEVSYSA